jgi:zinc resistance-associated protein
MKNVGKVSLLLVLALALSLGLAASVWAQPMGKSMGMKDLTPEQAGKIFDLKEKFHADTAALRKQMMVNELELAALWAAEKPDQNAIQAKQKERNALRAQMQEKMTAFHSEAKIIAPDFSMGMGMWDLTPEQAGKIFDLKEKFHADTAGLRKQMVVNELELTALWAAEKPDRNAIQAKQKEFNALRAQMQEKMTAFQSEAKEIAPDFDMGMGMGHGPGMGMGRGPGGGMGPGYAPPAK